MVKFFKSTKILRIIKTNRKLIKSIKVPYDFNHFFIALISKDWNEDFFAEEIEIEDVASWDHDFRAKSFSGEWDHWINEAPEFIEEQVSRRSQWGIVGSYPCASVSSWSSRCVQIVKDILKILVSMEKKSFIGLTSVIWTFKRHFQLFWNSTTMEGSSLNLALQQLLFGELLMRGLLHGCNNPGTLQLRWMNNNFQPIRYELKIYSFFYRNLLFIN